MVTLHFVRSAFKRSIVDDRRILRGLDDGVIPLLSPRSDRILLSVQLDPFTAAALAVRFQPAFLFAR